jgi:hypothetical protein
MKGTEHNSDLLDLLSSRKKQAKFTRNTKMTTSVRVRDSTGCAVESIDKNDYCMS